MASESQARHGGPSNLSYHHGNEGLGAENGSCFAQNTVLLDRFSWLSRPHFSNVGAQATSRNEIGVICRRFQVIRLLIADTMAVVSKSNSGCRCWHTSIPLAI